MHFINRSVIVVSMFLVGMVQSASADLIGVTPGFPMGVLGSTGSLSYDPATHILTIDAIPVAIRFNPTTPPRFVNPTGASSILRFSLQVMVDGTGALVSGIAGDDLTIVGEVDQDGDGLVDFSGVLLTGEVTRFGFMDSGGPTDFFDFRCTTTGGSLASLYAGRAIGLAVTSEGSSFVGDFSMSFSGGAKSVFGPLEPLCGDGWLDPGEECDDGNVLDGDGCSATCTLESQCPLDVSCNVVVVEEDQEEEDDSPGVEDEPSNEDCNPCSGKVTSLTLRYTGSTEKLIRVRQKKGGFVVFSDPVAPGEEFTFSGQDRKGTLGTEISIFVGRGARVKVHTSCSRPIGIGSVFGDFVVVGGTSRNGGALCPIGTNEAAGENLSDDDDSHSDGEEAERNSEREHDRDGQLVEIHFSAPDCADLSAVIDMGCDTIPVDNGQRVRVRCADRREDQEAENDSHDHAHPHHDKDSDEDHDHGHHQGKHADSSHDNEKEHGHGKQDNHCKRHEHGHDKEDNHDHHEHERNSDDHAGRCFFRLTDGVLVIHSNRAQLVVTATNQAGETAGCTSALCPADLQAPDECGSCEGKVTTLTLRYTGSTEELIEVRQNNSGDVLFSQVVIPGGQFTVVGQDKNGTLGTAITLAVGTNPPLSIHTSCSQPIGVGSVFGDFVVVAGASRRGGPLCPTDDMQEQDSD